MVKINLTSNKKTTKHSNDIMRNILKYSPEIFQEFSYATQVHYAEQAIIAKKYYELQHILNLNPQTYYLSEINNKAIDRFDKKAISVIMDFSKNSTNEYIKNGTYINKCMITSIYGQDISEPKVDPKLQKDIHTLLLNAKSVDTIDAEDLQLLSFSLSSQEFENFCQNKNLTITDEKFKTLDLSSYKYEDKTPVQPITKDSEYYLIDLLLNRTYSDSMPLDSIKAIYNKVYSLDSVAQEMLTYTAVLISKGNPLKIIFENGTLSYYSPMQKIIKIDTNFAKDPIFNIESVTSHEFMHFFYDEVFNNKASPISIKKFIDEAKNFTRTFKVNENDDDNDFYHFMREQYSHKEIFKSFSNLFSADSALVDIIENYISYQVAAKGPLMHAAKLLGVGLIESNSTIELAKQLKFNSYIDLFHIKSQSTMFKEMIIGNGTVAISESTYHTLLGMYQEHEIPKFHNKSEIVKWASEELYPDVLEQLKLSKGEIHFLERMADFINRAEFFPKVDFSCNSRSNSEHLDAELIVRSLELKASISNDTDIIQSFMALDQYHNKYASPVVALFLNENNQTANLIFSKQYLVAGNSTFSENINNQTPNLMPSKQCLIIDNPIFSDQCLIGEIETYKEADSSSDYFN